MNCWDILGIEPTDNRERIRQAYEQQMKFASDHEAEALRQAYQEATGHAPSAAKAPSEPEPRPEPRVAAADTREPTAPMDGNDAQIVREVIIQVRALLNDNYRQQDVNIWKAILCEPPADQIPLRREIASQLEHQVRPMAENGSFPAPVARFLGDWFEWFSVQEANPEPDERNYPESGMADDQGFDNQAEQPPQMMNFWPAVIGWIVGLAILAALFGGMGGG